MDRPQITAREQEVANLVLKGLQVKEVARELYLSESTVKTHLRSIRAKGFPLPGLIEIRRLPVLRERYGFRPGSLCDLKHDRGGGFSLRDAAGYCVDCKCQRKRESARRKMAKLNPSPDRSPS